MREGNEVKKLLLELADKAIYLHASLFNNPKPGELILRLPEAQRKLLQQLTSKDMEDLRSLPFLDIPRRK